MRKNLYDIGDILEMECADRLTHRYLILRYDPDREKYTVVEYDTKQLWLSTLTDMIRYLPGEARKIGHVDISALQQTKDRDIPDDPIVNCETCKKAEQCEDGNSPYGLEFFIPWENGMMFDDVKPWRFCPECGKRRKGV